MKGLYDPGALNWRMRLEQPVETADGFGALQTAWTEIGDVWAAMKPVDARFRQIADQTSEVQSHAITIRFRDDVSSGWRMILNQRVFEIDVVFDPDERARYLICMTREVGR
ncbi:MAG: phage head closure protein [Ahrensia sp.]|nr:phage head closure protein [Ahrensia sp.]